MPYTHISRDTPSFDRSVAQIETMLATFGCARMQVGKEYAQDSIRATLWFEFHGAVHKIDFPVTYLNDKLDMRVSGRLIYHHIKALLVAVETDYMDFAQAMMQYRALPDGNGALVAMHEAYHECDDALPRFALEHTVSSIAGGV